MALRTALFSLVAVVVMIARSAAADLVVVDARGADFKPGDRLAADAVIKLPAGARLTLVTVNGETVRLRGPFEDRAVRDAATGPGGVVDSLRNMMTRPTTAGLSPGAVRSGDTANLPEPWVIDVTKGGPRCVRADNPIVLWQPTASPTATPMVLRPADRRWEAKGSWPAGQDRVTMPQSLPVVSGQQMDLELNGVAVPLVFHVIPKTVDTDAMRAAFLLEVGCTEQGMVLARTIP